VTAADPSSHRRPERDETPEERADRNMSELLQELRVALPGVQVLFAFLLAVPFQQRFAEVTPFQEKTYFVVLLLSAAATAFLIAPSAYHRLNFAQGDKPHIVEVASRLSVIGLALLALAMSGAVLLVTDFLFGDATVAVTIVATVAVFAALWFVLPLARRAQNKKSS
jgi:membrane-bound acyltransferase YfiQ involved in biofilm formation